jgi:hypothetical protein
MINDTGLRVGPSKPAEHDLRKAWIAVALLPVAFVVAMFVGEGLISALGYDSGESVPVGPALLASIPALLVLIAPGSLPCSTATGHTAPPAGRPPSWPPGSAGQRRLWGRRQRLGVPGRALRR